MDATSGPMSADDFDEEARELTAVAEREELSQLVGEASSSGDAEAPFRAFPRFKEIMAKYQEMSQLLDPLLEGIVQPLAAALRQEAARGAEADLKRVQGVSRMLEAVSSTRGWKTVVKFFPNDVACLEPVVSLLLKVESEGRQKSTVDDDRGGTWETMCTLLLWLSMLLMVPFDLETIDSSQCLRQGLHGGQSLVETIISRCKDLLRDSGKAREMAAVALARLLTRPDTHRHLEEFIDWSISVLDHAGADDVFLIPAILHTLAAIFKLGSRTKLISAAAKVWSQVSQFASLETLQHQTMARKLTIKLLQRVALTFLPMRLSAWRYQKASQSLIVTLQGDNTAASRTGFEERQEESDEIEVVEEVEECVELLLQGLRDKDTIVRWSSAKGLGRVLSRLPKELGAEVVGCIAELMVPTESDSTWHGACLAFAELVRRGLLLPDQLPGMAPLIVQALEYDVRRGPHSVGAHVRDAAAYVCWAFARAYATNDIEAMTLDLAPTLLSVACYDREVNCRRAASAAFQEMVGRHGSYPHGIEIITIADYFTLSSRSNAYLHVAPSIAQFPEYRTHLSTSLIEKKLRHWEKTLRCLAAEALGALVPSDPQFFLNKVDEIRKLCMDSIIEVRHGACLGLGELVLALARAGQPLHSQDSEAVAGQVLEIEKARLYRGKGGELMRAATCRLLECTALAGVAVTSSQRKKLLDSLDEQLRHPSSEIQEAAARALHAFSRAYMFPGSEAAVERTTVRYCGLLHDPNVAVRRGCALALSSLHGSLLSPRAEVVLNSLISGLKIEDDPDDRDPESRRNSAAALGTVCRELFSGQRSESAPGGENSIKLLAACVAALLLALEDYSIDNRGDVGSWVREAAMESITHVYQLYSIETGVMQEEALKLLQQVVAVLLKQSVERIGRIREVAIRSMIHLFSTTSKSLLEGLPGLSQIRQVLDSSDVLPSIGSGGSSLAEIVCLVQFKEYQDQIFEGCVASIGGLDHSLSQTVCKALVQAISAAGGKSADDALEMLLRCWARNCRSKRLGVPLTKTADVLLSSFDMSTLENPGHSLRQVLDYIKEEARGCTDVPRLLGCATVLCHLISTTSDVQTSSLSAAMALLVNRFPKVRKFTAEQLYIRLMTLEGAEGGGEGTQLGCARDLEAAMDILASTTWDGSLQAAKEGREPLFAALDLPAPKKTENPRSSRVSSTTHNADENAQYASLLADAERGLGSGM